MKKQLIAGLILVSLGLSGQALALEVGKGSPYDYRIKSVVYNPVDVVRIDSVAARQRKAACNGNGSSRGIGAESRRADGVTRGESDSSRTAHGARAEGIIRCRAEKERRSGVSALPKGSASAFRTPVFGG